MAKINDEYDIGAAFEAIENGAITVEINPSETPLSAWMHHALRGPSGVILPALIAAAWPEFIV